MHMQIQQRKKISPSMDNPKTRYMSDEMAARFEEMSGRPDRLSVSDTIAMLDVRESLLYERMSKPSPDFKRLSELLAELRTAHYSPIEEEFDSAYARVMAALRLGIDNEETWDELQRVSSRRMSAVESERRRIIQERTVITVDQARALLSRMFNIIDLVVSDQVIKAKIMSEYRKSISSDKALKIVV